MSIAADTYIKNYQMLEGLVIDYKLTSSHTIVLYDCLKADALNRISLILNDVKFIKISIIEMNLTNNSLVESKEHLETYGNRIQYVLAAETKISAYHAKNFQLMQALKTYPTITDLEITHCCI